jgi:DNA repair exonuclease SbcCD nuclease subunit
MKLVHTADIHLDMCFSAFRMPPEFGNRRRQGLKDVLRRIFQRAADWPADALLIAGDLFDLERVSRDTVGLLLHEFRAMPHVPVMIAPGNADPYTAASPYAAETWPKNVHIFRKPLWESVTLLDGELTVHGFGFDRKEISSNPFGTLAIPKTNRNGVHVAVAHGSERTTVTADKPACAPFDADQAATDGLDYLALGHHHSATPIRGDFDTAMWYSGAPEGHSLREPGPHVFLEIEIARGRVEVTPVQSSRVIYSTHRFECDAFATAQDLVDAVRALAREEQTRQIARVVLTGNLDASIQGELGLVYDAAALDFEYLQLFDKTAPLEDYEALMREDTSLGAFVKRLNEQISTAEDEGQRQKFVRAREVGVACFRQRDLEIRGLERG